MTRSARTGFLLRAILFGLALALGVILLKPSLVARQSDVVEVATVPATTGVVPTQGPASYAEAVRTAAPAVVNINTAKIVTVQPNPFYNDPFFRQFFGDMIQQGPNLPRKRVENSLGSGVIINSNGYILTNNHVIRGADEIHVYLQDGRSADAKIIGTDPETDVAVLKVELNDLPTVTLADSDHV